MMGRLSELDLLSIIHPALQWDAWLADRFTYALTHLPGLEWEIKPADEIQRIRDLLNVLWLLRLDTDQVLSVSARFKYSASMARTILLASQLYHYHLPELKKAPPSLLAERLADYPASALYAVYIAIDDEKVKEQLYVYVTKLKRIKPTISGDALRARGLRPGPEYRVILDGLKKAWLDGKVDSQETEAELLEKLIQETIHAEE
jgi:tRNA nucleotidyltransferase (CCA-adding enzyme)